MVDSYAYFGNMFINFMMVATPVAVYGIWKWITYQSPEEKEHWRKFHERMDAFEKERETDPIWKELEKINNTPFGSFASQANTRTYSSASSYQPPHARSNHNKTNATNKTRKQSWEDDNEDENIAVQHPNYQTDPEYAYRPDNVYHDTFYGHNQF